MTAAARTVLVVEDDAKIAGLLENYLQAHGYATHRLANGLDVVPYVRRASPALVLLDLMLPGQGGVEVCRELRAFSAVPIIMVTARIDELDRLLGLEVGADDYVCKPFSPREVLARVKALLRRAEGRFAAPQGFQHDPLAQRIAWEGRALPLTPMEYRLFAQMVARPGQVFTRARLMEGAGADGGDANDRAIDSHIKNLRRKICQVRPQGSGIASVYGLGYRFEPDAADP